MAKALALMLALACAACGSSSGQTKDPTKSPAELLDDIDKAAAAPLEPVSDPAKAGGPAVVLRGGTVMTAAGERFEPGYVIFEAGRIKAVGEGEPGAVEGAKVLDVKGHVVTPGLIDTHSHLGVYPAPGARAHSDGNEATAPATPGVWAEHGFWPQDPGLWTAIAGGITTLHVLPGSANLIGGRSVTFHLVPRRSPRAMRFPGAPHGVKMACGENPKRVYGTKGRAPSTRMGNLRGQREAFVKAQQYLDKLKKAKPGELLPRDVDMETLAGILEGRHLAQVHCYRADDIVHILELAEEFGFEVRSIHHGLEAYKVRDILAAKNVSVSTWADWWGFKLEAYDGIRESAALLHESGVKAIIHSDSSRGIQRLNQEAGKALYAGKRIGVDLSEDDALQWITINPAWALGIEAEVGTLEVGKRADIVVWDGSPFSVYTRARWVFIDGQLLYDKDRPGEHWSDFMLGQGVAP